MSNKELGIYIHIPFCKRKCYYCDFISYPNKTNFVKEYINCLKKEINNFDFSSYNVTTIYLGGGTPSYINENFIKEIFDLLKEKLKKNKTEFENIETTIEINPGTADNKKLKMYKQIGIHRLSIGLQSTQDRLLKEIGRIHTYNDFLNTYKTAEKLGFNNINVDLMIGLPNQSIRDIKGSLEKIVGLNPKHISVYSLILEEGTIIYKKVKNHELKLPSEDLERKMYWYVKDYLELHGYNQYEISNFSKKGYESKHNLNCWNQKEYIGFGVAAHSYIDNVRFSNTDDLEKYINNMENNKINLNKHTEEVQTKKIQENEFMMLGFRKLQGVDISAFKNKFAENPLFLYKNELNKLVNEGLIIVDLNYIYLTNKGLDFANLVFEEFI